MNISSEEAYRRAVDALGDRMREVLLRVPAELQGQVNEIRLRQDRPLMLDCRGRKIFLNDRPLRPVFLPDDSCITVREEDLELAFRRLCDYSVHSHQDQIRAGYITIAGGHRAGICGTAVTENGRVTAVRGVTGINLRICRAIPGAADELLRRADPRRTRGIVLAGPPASGKTTILRDLAQQLSGGSRQLPVNVAVIDEKGEISGGIADSSRIGMCCDVFQCYPKGEGILQAVRNMAPEVILCDEVGSCAELASLEEGFNAGVHVVASVHARDLHDLKTRPVIRRMLESGSFETVVLLRGGVHVGEIETVVQVEDKSDENGGHDLRFRELGAGRMPEIHAAG